MPHEKPFPQQALARQHLLLRSNLPEQQVSKPAALLPPLSSMRPTSITDLRLLNTTTLRVRARARAGLGLGLGLGLG